MKKVFFASAFAVAIIGSFAFKTNHSNEFTTLYEGTTNHCNESDCSPDNAGNTCSTTVTRYTDTPGCSNVFMGTSRKPAK